MLCSVTQLLLHSELRLSKRGAGFTGARKCLKSFVGWDQRIHMTLPQSHILSSPEYHSCHSPHAQELLPIQCSVRDLSRGPLGLRQLLRSSSLGASAQRKPECRMPRMRKEGTDRFPTTLHLILTKKLVPTFLAPSRKMVNR
jgi:hypothetical protein